MPAYSFENLSAFEFTELVRDLLHARDGLRLIISPEGPDGGIDILAPETSDRKAHIVQCKRYERSRFSALLANLRPEVDRVRRLAPERYFIAVSVPLSLSQRGKVLSLFRPFIKSDADILDNGDLNALLRDFPGVETAHYKLWVQSSAILTKLLHEGTGVWREQTKAEIRDASKVYVQTPAFKRALDILNSEGVVVIAGTAGIGKTTLAQALVARHVQQEYAFYEIEGLHEEPKALPAQGNVVLYFDDFLGRSVMRDNADALTEKRIDRLFDLVARETRFRLVLTTRTYLMEDAKRLSDACSMRLKTKNDVVLTVGDFSRTTKAHILYNHLYFKEIDGGHCRPLADWKTLSAILDHPNFVPRIVQWVCTSKEWPSSLKPADFGTYVLEVLRSPRNLYRDPVAERIGTRARDVLFVLAAWGRRCPVRLDTLRDGLNAMYGRLGLTLPNSREYQSALKVIDGSLVMIVKDKSAAECVRFANPGVEEAARAVLWSYDDRWKALAADAGSGSVLLSLASCHPDVTHYVFADNAVQLPSEWYERWRSICGNPSIFAGETLVFLGEALALNIWVCEPTLVVELVASLRGRDAEYWEEELPWSQLGASHIPDDTLRTLNTVAWLDDELEREAGATSKQYSVADSEFEAFYDRVGRLGIPGAKARSACEERANEFVTSIIAEARETECLQDGRFREAGEANTKYKLNRDEDIEAIARFVQSSPQTTRPTVLDNSVERTESDATILAMFRSLAERGESSPVAKCDNDFAPGSGEACV